MWQRIQTLYLALATGLIVAMMFSLKAVVPGADGTFLQEVKYTAYTPYIILIIVIALLDFLALTTFRFREFQMRTAVLAAIITPTGDPFTLMVVFLPIYLLYESSALLVKPATAPADE